MNNYQRCTRCVMDNKQDNFISFDQQGYCEYCIEALKNKNLVYFPNTEGRDKLDRLIDKLKKEGKGKKYDCLMGISGGLDSSYLLYLGYQWGLRILAVHVDDSFDAPIATRNIEQLCDKCNIDLKVLKPDEEQFCDLTRAFVYAEVPNLAMPQDNILFAELYNLAKKHNVKTFLSGGNFALESILKPDGSVNCFDLGHIRDINKRYGTKPINKLNMMSNYQRVLDRYLFGIKTVRPLNYIDYNKNKAIKELNEFCGFVYYETKHCENILTKVNQLYWLVKKFGDDKRTSHLSSLIVSGQMTREEALAELNKPPYDKEQMESDIEFFCNKINISVKDFNTMVSRPGKSHDEYKVSCIYKFVRRFFSRWILSFKG